MFTTKELSQIDTIYFNLIKNNVDFIELQSMNTKHFWIIKKNLTYSKTPIVLYHKHSLLNKYYHKHSRVNSVNQAIQKIVSHDKFVLNS